MSKKIANCSTIIVVLLLFALSGALSTQAQQTAFSYRYSYITQDASGNYLLNVIHPPQEVGATYTTDTVVIPLSTTGALISAEASPDGRWIVLASPENEYTNISLLDTDSNELMQVFRAYQPHDFLPRDYLPLWSPDGNYFALNARRFEGESLSTYVYSIERNEVFLIYQGYELIFPYHLLWSSDSNYLAIASAWCPANSPGCSGAIAVHSIPNGEFVRGIDLDYFDYGGVRSDFLRENFCDYEWSPGGRYISFQFGCYPGVREYSREIYAWDTQQMVLNPVTQFTNSPPPWTEQPATAFAHINYDTFWYDEQTLFTGVVGATGLGGLLPGSPGIHTLEYRFPEQEVAVVNSSYSQDWQRNPVTEAVAYLSEEISIDEENRLSILAASVNVAMPDTGSLNVIASGPVGCDLHWSPDGNVLAYSISNVPPEVDLGCRYTEVGFAFLDMLTGEVGVFDLPPGVMVYPVGWIAERNGQAATPTMTPFPTGGLP